MESKNWSLRDYFFDIFALHDISFESRAVKKMDDLAKSRPLPTLGGHSLIRNQPITTEFESHWRYAALNGIILSYSWVIVIHELREGIWTQKFYINRPRENQNMRQCYGRQVSIRETQHFIVEVKKVRELECWPYWF